MDGKGLSVKIKIWRKLSLKYRECPVLRVVQELKKTE